MSKFKQGDRVRKTSGSEWQGRIVGWYSTKLTPEGYAVESEAHAGSVQIYPAKALELVEAEAAPAAPTVKAEQVQCETCQDSGIVGHSDVCPECQDTWQPAPSLPAAGSLTEPARAQDEREAFEAFQSQRPSHWRITNRAAWEAALKYKAENSRPAQTEQQPVAWRMWNGKTWRFCYSDDHGKRGWEPLYIHPAPIEQQPVAWLHSRTGAVATDATKRAMEDGSVPSGYDIPLYAAPIAQTAPKDLRAIAMLVAEAAFKAGNGHDRSVGSDTLREIVNSVFEQLGMQTAPQADCEWCAGAGHDPYGDKCQHCQTAPQPRQSGLVPEGYALVPITPTEDQWSGLARDLMMWLDMNDKTPQGLFQHLRILGVEPPQWLRDEPEMQGTGVPSKGTRVTLIYRAMIEDFLAAQGERNE